MGSLAGDVVYFDNDNLQPDNVIPDVLAAKNRRFRVGDKIEVKICPNPVSYGHFFVTPFSERKSRIDMDNMLLRLSSLGELCRHVIGIQYYEELDEVGKLCCVEHWTSKKHVRGRIESGIDVDGNVAVYLIDSGELGNYPACEVRELADQAKKTAPLAFKCCLPIALNTDEEMAEVMRRFICLNHKELFVTVFESSAGLHTVDIVILKEGVTFCEALLRVGDVKFDPNLSTEMRQEIENSFMEKDGPPIPSVDKDAFEPISFNARLKKDGFTLEPSGLSISNMDKNENEEGSVEDLFEHSVSHLAKLSPIEGLVDKRCYFNYYFGMNSFLLMEVKMAKKYWVQLADAIYSCTNGDQVKFDAEEVPKKNQVVLVPDNGGGGKFRRGVITAVKMSPKYKKLNTRVRLLECGTEKEVFLEELAKPNQEIMDIPLFVYFVKLYKVNDDIPILIEHFQKFRTLVDGEGFVTKVIHDPSFKSVLPKVVMIESGNGESLAQRLNKLAVWQWRQLYRAMYTTNTEIIRATEHPLPTMLDYFEKCRINKLIPGFVDVRVQYCCPSICGNYAILFCLPNNSVINYQHRTIQSQLQLFSRRVHASLMSEEEVKAYPHMLSVKLKQDSEKRTLFTSYAKLCTWHRVFYSSCETSAPLNCIDCFWDSTDFKDLQISALPIDFYQTCPLGLLVEIKLNSPDEANSRNFLPGARNKIRLLDEPLSIENDFPLYQAILVD